MFESLAGRRAQELYNAIHHNLIQGAFVDQHSKAEKIGIHRSRRGLVQYQRHSDEQVGVPNVG